MHCASCGQPTDATPCHHCEGEPRLDGRYRLLSSLGEGATGTTWAADGPSGPVAIKELRLSATRDGKQRELFRREAAVLRQLNHPRIPRWVEDFELRTGRHRTLFVVQERVEGETLAARLVSHRYSEDEVLALLADLCPVLAYLHGLSPPVVHRDLKPTNVMRRPDGTHVLLDFGSVRDALTDPAVGGSTVTGTFGYMAPEQFAGEASPRTDLYGLGALAVALLTREEPSRLLAGRRLAWEGRARVSPGMAALLADLLAEDAVDRPASAVAAAHRIAALRASPPEERVDRREPTVLPTPPAPAVRFAEPAPVLEDVLGPQAPNQPPGRPTSGTLGRGGAAVVGAGFTIGLALVLLLVGLGGALLVLAPVPAPLPIHASTPLPFAPACPAAIRDPAGEVVPGTTTFDWVAGSPDGRRVAVLLSAGGFGKLQVVDVGSNDLVWEVAAPAGPTEAFAMHAQRLTDLGLRRDAVPAAVPWCGVPGQLQVDGLPLDWNPIEEPCEGGGTRTQFEVCPADGPCAPAPPLSMCWDEPPRPVGAYRAGDVLWLLVERPMRSHTPRFVTGLLLP